ncbi:outer membrane lipoprotein-sorting protein [Thorsellia kenyensis]|uniref:Outer membrane lipoprotein-sorting protein n=1 Tax=Thorsellia kenyensis TaxID=1549888 RepID=A0ABV6CGA6_9GAMM
MFRYLISTLIFFVSIQVYASSDAQTMLQKSDSIRTPGNSFTLNAQISSYKNKSLDAQTVLKLFSKRDNDQMQFKTLLKYLEPSRDQGKLMLKNEDNLWAFDPKTSASVPISPQQRLTGQAANGDVVTSVWALDYNASLVKEEQITDGDKQNRNANLLELNAKNANVTYYRILYWIDANTNSPIKAQFYTKSGELLKTAYYRGFKTIEGLSRPTETVIIDGVNPNWVTIMQTSNHQLENISDAWFQRAYLPNIN